MLNFFQKNILFGKTRWYTFFVVGALLSISTLLNAGLIYQGNVTVYLQSDGSGYFQGPMNVAQTADSIQYIGCESSPTRIYCVAKDINGNSAYASSDESKFIEMIKAMSSKVFIQVDFDKSGEITDMRVGHFSSHAQ